MNHGISASSPIEFVAGYGPVAKHPIKPTLWQKYLVNNILGIGSFTQHYFFPDGELEPVSEVNLIAAKCGLELRDFENLREHYALTLQRWVELMEIYSAAAIQATNEATLRTWRLYMASSSHNFSTGITNVNQSLLCKPNKGKANLPLTRSDLYVDLK